MAGPCLTMLTIYLPRRNSRIMFQMTIQNLVYIFILQYIYIYKYTKEVATGK